MFAGPQWNTWIEMPYDESSQDRVLAYARGVVDEGFPPGVLMIDDRWSVDYGNWTFDVARFPDPAAMTAELHRLGFHVMVWLVPFVSPDSAISRRLEHDGLLITGADGEPVVRHWWNGWSTMLDLGNPAALDWLRAELDRLRDVGVDGFKFDAGDVRDWRPGDVSASGGGAADYAEAWAAFAAEYEFNELRACWKAGGRPLAQRLHDKPPSWGRDGLLSLIPEGIAQGLIGHPFNCPDMIGGGELSHFADGVPVDQELFVRFTQCAALFPMMQFSLAPWRLLDAEHLAAVEAAVALASVAVAGDPGPGRSRGPDRRADPAAAGLPPSGVRDRAGPVSPRRESARRTGAGTGRDDPYGAAAARPLGRTRRLDRRRPGHCPDQGRAQDAAVLSTQWSRR